MLDFIAKVDVALRFWNLVKKSRGPIRRGRLKLIGLLQAGSPPEPLKPVGYTKEHNAFWKDGVPYCLRCMEEDGKARTLIQQSEYNTAGICPTCKTGYRGVFRAKRGFNSPSRSA